ncbi:MAG: hypothetical protein AAFQ10_03460 [Pseudomonadota bacterium]
MDHQFDNLAYSNDMTAFIFNECLAVHPHPAEIDPRKGLIELAAYFPDENAIVTKWTANIAEVDRVPPLTELFQPELHPKGSSIPIGATLHQQLIWMDAEGYVRYQPNFSTKRMMNGDNVVSLHSSPSETILTAKSLGVLSKVPPSLSERATPKSMAKTVGKGGVKATGNAISREAVAWFFEKMAGL